MPDMKELMNKLQNEGLSPSKVKAIVINYPNNPLGATCTREYLQKIVNFCRDRNILLISDAAYADMYFGDQKLRQVFLNLKEQRIFLSNFTA